jgi:4a-hydroxytetrahydrobiopterin dehydratase
MSKLSTRHCTALPKGTPALDSAAARRLLSELDSAWAISSDGSELVREFKFADFYRTMSFVNAIAHVANVEDHHPDLEIGYSRCKVRYSTHSVGGLSDNDFICAAKIDALDTAP